MMRARTLLVWGFAACALALLLAAVDARAAMAGWLAGFVLWSAVPLGALGLRTMTEIIPGAWRGEVTPAAQMLMMTLPLLALAVLPILIGVKALYPWFDHPSGHGVYLSIWFFALRSVVLIGGAIALAFLMATRPARRMPLAAGGLIAFTLVDTTVMVDWLMSLEPDFHSSGFGLYALSIQMTIALMAITIIRLRLDPDTAQAGLLGGLILTALLLWDYFAFMQYFIIWSENLPKQVAWFKERDVGIWPAAEWAFSLLAIVPTVLLFFNAIRRSRAWLLAIAAAVMLGKAIEIAWLVFPAVQAPAALGVLAMLLSLLGLGLLAAAFLAVMARAPGALAREAAE